MPGKSAVMCRYRYGPLVLEAALALPELIPASTRGPAFLRIEVAETVNAAHVQWYHQWRHDSGRVWRMLGRGANRYIVRFPRVADFDVAENGGRIVVAARRSTQGATLRHLLLDQVLPLALAHRGQIVLHGAAVLGSAGAVGLLGATGRGKSTLTASFAAAGLRALTDDTLLVSLRREKRIAVHPTYPSLRVWPDAAAAVLPDQGRDAPSVSDLNGKLRVGGASGIAFSTAPSHLRVLYVLVPDDRAQRIAIDPLSPGERVLELMRHTFVLDWSSAGEWQSRFERLVDIARGVPIRRLRFRQSFDDLTRVRTEIVEDVERQVARPC